MASSEEKKKADKARKAVAISGGGQEAMGSRGVAEKSGN